MLAALRNRVYRHLYFAQIVALLGTGLATVALGLLAYDIAGPRAGTVLGTALAIKMVAYVVVAPIAAAVVTRWPRKAVLIGADLTRIAVAVSLPFVGEVWQVYILIFVLQASSATFTPTFQSVIPDVLPDEADYTAALSLSRLAYDLESVVSPMVAALLLVVTSSSTLFFGTAVGLAGSVLLVASVAIPTLRDQAVDAPTWVRARAGIVLFGRTPALRPIIALNLVVASAGAYVIVQTVVIVRSVFALPEQAVAWLLGVNGLGSMIAAFTLPRVLKRVAERRLMLSAAVVLTVATAIIPVGLVFAPDWAGLVVIGVLWLVIGVAWSAAETPVGRLIRRNVDRGDLPVAFAAQFSLSHACWLITYPVAGWLGAIGLGPTATVLAVVALVGTVMAWRTWPKPPLMADAHIRDTAHD
ncbi:MAG: MFS transporter [Propionibacteriaceae bacterium]|jgi:MFS family permease|nr:MFS transporter [Propionibacteriaceae bacterium]